MKRFLLLTLPVLIIVAAGFMIFGLIQAGFEEDKMMDDLYRKASAVAESAEVSAALILTNNNLKAANNLVESFQKRERMQGCILYDKKGKVIAETKRIKGWQGSERKYIKDVITTGELSKGIEKFNEYTVYRYAIPVKNDNGRVLGAVELVYDTSYVFSQLTTLWKRIGIFSILLVVFTMLALLLLQRQIFILPVLRLTDWFKKFQKGEINTNIPIKEQDEFGRLISEVEQVALSLRVARRSVSEDATRRVERTELWTEARLKTLIHARVGDNAMIIVSNREPYMHVRDEEGKVRCITPAGGVVTALDPIMKASGGTWIAHGSGDADKLFVNSKDKLGVPVEDPRYILKRVWLTKQEEEGYYYGFSNEGLWPLCHMTHTRPEFKQADWEMYKTVNAKFAQSVLDELPVNGGFVFIQDYHFTLLPKMIKEKRPDVTVAMFWHIPWPNPEVFAICPYYQDILEGMLGCDLLGFHVQYHCNNFLDTVNRLLESRINTETFSIVRAGMETFVKPFPISIEDDNYGAKESARYASAGEKMKNEYGLQDKIIGIGVDRIDYTKGLVERMLAIEALLDKNPQYRGKLVFVQIGAPSRTHIKSYHDLNSALDAEVERINWKFGDGDWKPVIYLKRHFSQEEIIPFYMIADFCVVSSLHDGMNLVAKEYVASKEKLDGVLVLSTFTGAAREFGDAVLINPYSTVEFAQALEKAITMDPVEKRRRMENMRATIKNNNVYKWAGDIISQITGLKKQA
ncbi:MAG: trehalose-6-phosphate synthase [Spirochaetia bacterium]|nr:trehalose-6-phosphate synthase [Spirochaetia bacterium]